MKNYESTSSLDKLIEKTLTNLKTITETRTIFGEQITTLDGTTIIPISKATIGFVVGGGEYADLSSRRVATHFPMAGGSGGGICLTPIGFLISTNSEIKYIPTSSENNLMKIIENLGKVSEYVVDKLTKKEDKGDD